MSKRPFSSQAKEFAGRKDTLEKLLINSALKGIIGLKGYYVIRERIFNQKTFKQIGTECNCTQWRVGKIFKDSLEKLDETPL